LIAGTAAFAEMRLCFYVFFSFFLFFCFVFSAVLSGILLLKRFWQPAGSSLIAIDGKDRLKNANEPEEKNLFDEKRLRRYL
jgi:hypothetical protein